MKNLICSILLLINTYPAFADNVDINYNKAKLNTQKTDKALNVAYQSAIKRMPDENGNFTLEGLKQSQKDWLKYRNSQCALTSNTLHIFSNEEAEKYELCLTEFNKNRTAFLNNFYLE